MAETEMKCQTGVTISTNGAVVYLLDFHTNKQWERRLRTCDLPHLFAVPSCLPCGTRMFSEDELEQKDR